MRLPRFVSSTGREALWVLASLLLLLPLTAQTQAPPPSTDDYTSLKGKNLSALWLATSRMHPDRQYSQGKSVAFPDPIGFIGPSYQRFYMHYTSIPWARVGIGLKTSALSTAIVASPTARAKWCWCCPCAKAIFAC